MNDFPPPRVSAVSTSSRTTRAWCRSRVSDLALGNGWVAASVLTLVFGGTAAADSPAADTTAALRALLAQRLPKELGLELSPLCFRSDAQARDCTLKGDFDGDDKPDLAVVVQKKSCGSGGSGHCQRVGIAFLLGSGKPEVLGAGQGRWRHINRDTGQAGPAAAVTRSYFASAANDAWFWRVWHATAQGPRPRTGHGPQLSKAPPGMRGDGIELSGGDASMMLYRTAQGWITYDLGY